MLFSISILRIFITVSSKIKMAMCDDIIDDKEIINDMKNEWDIDNLSSMLEIFLNMHLYIEPAGASAVRLSTIRKCPHMLRSDHCTGSWETAISLLTSSILLLFLSAAAQSVFYLVAYCLHTLERKFLFTGKTEKTACRPLKGLHVPTYKVPEYALCSKTPHSYCFCFSLRWSLKMAIACQLLKGLTIEGTGRGLFLFLLKTQLKITLCYLLTDESLLDKWSNHQHFLHSQDIYVYSGFPHKINKDLKYFLYVFYLFPTI